MNSLRLFVWAWLTIVHRVHTVHGLKNATPEVVQYALLQKVNLLKIDEQVEHHCGASMRSDAGLLFPSKNISLPLDFPRGSKRIGRMNVSLVLPRIVFDAECARIRAQVASHEESVRIKVLDLLLSKFKRQLNAFLHGTDEMTYALLRLRESVNLTDVVVIPYFYEPLIATLGHIYANAMNTGKWTTTADGFSKLNHTVTTMCLYRSCTENFRNLLGVFEKLTFLFSANIRNRAIGTHVDKAQLWALFGAPALRGLLYSSPQDLVRCKQRVNASRTWYDTFTINDPDPQACVAGSLPDTPMPQGVPLETWPSGQPGVPLSDGCLQDSHCFELGSVCNVTTRVCSSSNKFACLANSDCQGTAICREGICVDSDAWNFTKYAGVDKQIAAEAAKVSLGPDLLKVDFTFANVWMGLYDEHAVDYLFGHPIIQDVFKRDNDIKRKHDYLKNAYGILEKQNLTSKSFDLDVEIRDELLRSHVDVDEFAMKKERECSDKIFLHSLAKTHSHAAMYDRVVDCAATLTYAKMSCYRNLKSFAVWQNDDNRVLGAADRVTDGVEKTLNSGGLQLVNKGEFSKYVNRNFSAQVRTMAFNCEIPFDPVKVFNKISPLMQLAKEITSGVLESFETKIKEAFELPALDLEGTQMKLAPVALEFVEVLIHLSHGLGPSIAYQMGPFYRHHEQMKRTESDPRVTDEFHNFIGFYKSSRKSVIAECMKMAGTSSKMSHEPQSIFKTCITLKVAELSYTSKFNGSPFKQNCAQAFVKDAKPIRYIVDCRDRSKPFDPSPGAIKTITRFSEACQEPLHPYVYIAKEHGKGTTPKLFCSMKPSQAIQCTSDNDTCKSLGKSIPSDTFGTSSCSSSRPFFFDLVDRYNGQCIFREPTGTPRNDFKFTKVPELVEKYLSDPRHVRKIPADHWTSAMQHLNPAADAGALLADIIPSVFKATVGYVIEASEWVFSMVAFRGMLPKNNITALGVTVTTHWPTGLDEFVANDGLAKMYKLTINLGLLALQVFPSLEPGLSAILESALDILEDAGGAVTGVGESLGAWLAKRAESVLARKELEAWGAGVSSDFGEGLMVQTQAVIAEGTANGMVYEEELGFGEQVLEFKGEYTPAEGTLRGDVVRNCDESVLCSKEFITREPEPHRSLQEYFGLSNRLTPTPVDGEFYAVQLKPTVERRGPPIGEMMQDTENFLLFGVKLNDDGSVIVCTQLNDKYLDGSRVLARLGEGESLKIYHTVDIIDTTHIECINVELSPSQVKAILGPKGPEGRSLMLGVLHGYPLDEFRVSIELKFTQDFPDDVQMTFKVTFQQDLLLAKVVFRQLGLF